MDSKKDLLSMDTEELKGFLEDLRQPPYRAGQLFSWLHEKIVFDISKMSDLSKRLREEISEKAYIPELYICDITHSKDGTEKYLLRLYDGILIESVLMKYRHGYSVCVSTQAGCGMDCMFCASGKGGFVRNLSASEIIGQVYALAGESKCRIDHVVFMGMGEPLLNYDNVVKAISLLSCKAGQNISQRHMSVSTCGIVPGILKLADEKLSVTLALSLHAALQKKRESIMPVAKKYDLSQVIAACDHYRKVTKRRITYEYCLIAGINDQDEDVLALTGLLKDTDAHVNLIACHRIEEMDIQRDADIAAFKRKLEKNRINVTIRRNLGQDADASCGQLRMKGRENLLGI